ncbi:T9SS-dependent choice-of-anchor J family protein [Psychroserpens algicola]|uniref:T9SS type A sorting domain-containing protein n=1 Tax=Psychroserpens algicola TaxID=1719034 RepID=A0ABT0H950_9FLAO|nr:choice-of-anchor J domain-containing protein [Psychroserpens algicola]MCK8480534.1 T9SS type A sorting domain-containing protein [Psychroserpens algicola]
MKHFYTFLLLLLLGNLGFGQTTIWVEDFETDGDSGIRYNSSNTFNDGTNDHFGRTDGSDISGTYNIPNNSFFWAGEDLDDNGGDGSPTKTITFNSINISGYTDITFKGLFASGNGGSGWDDGDILYLEYSLDGGPYQKFIQFASPSGGSNVGLNHDPNLDGTGEGAAITTTFTEYSSLLGVTGNSIQIRLFVSANSASEEFGFDNLILEGILASSGPNNPDAFSAAVVSSSQINLNYDDNADGDDVVIVFNTDNNFDTPSGTPTVGNDFGDDEILFIGNTSGTFNHTGLTENTTYYYRAYSYDGTDYSNGLDADATTPCNAITVTNATPFQEGFEGGTVPPSCWASFRGTNGLGTAQDWELSTTPNSGINAAFVRYENVSGGNAEDWLVTPALDLSTLTNTELSFFTRDAGFGDDSDYSIRVSTTSQTDQGTFSTVNSYTAFGNTYINEIVDLSSFDGQTIYIAFVMSQDNGDSWYLDDIEVKEGTSKLSDIVEANYDEPNNIDYTLFPNATPLTTSNAIKIGEFTIRDEGGAPDTDGLGTTLTDITFTVDGFENIDAIALFDGPANVGEVTNVTASTTFNSLNSGSGITATTGSSTTFWVYATFKTTVTDNDQIQLTISSATADSSGSTFATSDAGGATNDLTETDDNRIEVTASQLVFSQQPPSSVAINAAMADVIVEAQDINNNVDSDFISNIDITSTGALSASPVSETAIAGIATFSTITHTAADTNLELTATDGTFLVTSTTFDVSVLPSVIAIQDFETSPQTPVFNYSNTNGGFATGSGPVPNDDNFVSGTRGWEANNETSTLTFGPIDVSGYTDIELDFRLAAFATSTNGLDVGDNVLVEVSLDNGATFSDEIEINGNDNAKWSFDTGEAPATVVYDGDNSQASFAPAGGGNRTTDGYSFISVTDITNSSQLVIRITMANNSSNEFWVIDDVILSGILLQTNDSDSEIYAATPQIGNSTIIAANSTTIATDAEVFGFVIDDQGSGDGLATNVTKMRFVPGSANTALWSTAIEGITLYDENLVDYTPAVTISDTEIILDFGTPISITDGGSLEFVLGFYLKTTGIVDNSIVQFQVDDSANGFTADTSGSGFIDPLTSGTFTGPETTINVVASDLVFSQQPTNTEINIAIDPAVIVDAVDTNGNLDLDYTDPIDLTITTLTFAGSATTSVNAINGSSTFDNLLINSTGVGNLTASSTGLNNSSLSDPFGVAPNRSNIWCETFTDNSLYNVTLGGEGKGPDTIETDYFHITDGSDIDIAYNGNNGNFFAAQDIDDGSWTGSANPSQLTWTGINIEGYSGIRFSGKFASAALNSIDPADEVLVEYRTNGTDPWVSFLAFKNNGIDNNTFFQEDTDFDDIGDGIQLTDTFQTFNKLLLTTASDTTIDLRLTVRVNSGAEDVAFEDFKIEGIGGTYPGNAATGFDGPLGTGSFEIDASSGSTINFIYNRGVGGTLGLFENHIVVYIDSKAGGITSTTNLIDAGDDGRKAISGFDGNLLRSVVNFPPGFEPDYAISLHKDFAGLFEIIENGSHNFIQSANLNPLGSNNNANYTFNIDFSSINALAGGESFKFLATYINASGAFRSNESIGDNTATGNPGTNPIEFTTYYQASSRKKGGLAPSTANGLWTTSETWVNGNAPLDGDEIIINNTVNLNTDYTTNDIEITATGIFTVNSASDFEITGGVVGSGLFNVNGDLIISEGGFTNIVPTYTTGSSLTYNNILATYNRFNEWQPGTTVGLGVPDNVIIDNSDLDLSNPSANITVENFAVGNNVSVFNGGNLNIDPTKSLTVNGDFANVISTVNMNSNSQKYSSLIVGGTSIGEVTYKRHVNTFNNTTGTTTGQNDLISAPVTNSSQTFLAFRTVNTNIPTGTIGGVPSFLFGPFDNDANTYINYNASNDSDVLTAGVGYRSASTNTSTFTFVGDVETNSVTVGIDVGALSEWNLIGNPYPSYISMLEFLTENDGAFNSSSSGIYGYDGDATDGFVVRNLGYFVLNPDELIAPGQGFLVASVNPAATVNFTPAMRMTGSSDDFIMGRQGFSENAFITLEISKDDLMYMTDLYFLTENVSLGLDPGYDTSVFGNVAPDDFAIFSHLIESNEGIDMAIQSLPSSSLSSVIVPLGVNVNNGEQFTISIKASSLPESIDVYLEDTVNNTLTLLNNSDYVYTATTDINDTGRYFLRFTENSLSTQENSFDNLNIYNSKTTKEIVVNGQLLENTICNIYDIQGRIIFSTTDLDYTSLENRIDVSTVSTGVYIIKLQSNNLERTQKLVIE